MKNFRWVRRADSWWLTADDTCPNKAALYDNGRAIVWNEGRGLNDMPWIDVDIPPGLSFEEKQAFLLAEYRLQ
jgi:hypothetical protein